MPKIIGAFRPGSPGGLTASRTFFGGAPGPGNLPFVNFSVNDPDKEESVGGTVKEPVINLKENGVRDEVFGCLTEIGDLALWGQNRDVYQYEGPAGGVLHGRRL